MPKSTPHSYEGQEISITFDKHRCIHAAQCGRGLPEVFDVNKRPWVDPDGAPLEDILAVVNRCPSGALKVLSKTGTEIQAAPQNAVRVEDSGPLQLRGELNIALGEDTINETRLTLCRCGKSKNKPYCDNSHKDDFTDAGGIAKAGVEEADTAAQGAVSVKFAPNGPIITEGAVVVNDAVGATKVLKEKAFLCRCGASKMKPWCDGSHKAVGFDSDGS